MSPAGKIVRQRLGASAGLLLLVLTPAAAQDAAAPPPPEEAVAVQAYGVRHNECAEWTDGCVVCARGDTGASHCSTPGIACQPVAISCRKPAGR